MERIFDCLFYTEIFFTIINFDVKNDVLHLKLFFSAEISVFPKAFVKTALFIQYYNTCPFVHFYLTGFSVSLITFFFQGIHIVEKLGE